MKISKAIFFLFLASTATEVLAHPYNPLRTGDVTVVKYHFRVEGGKEGPMKAQEVLGTMTYTKGALETKEGKEYLKTTTSYKDIPYVTEDQHTWRRDEDGRMFVASMLHDKWNETMELPADVSVGQEWDYFDGVQSKRKVTAVLSVTSPDGKVFNDCIEVSRIVVSNEKLKTVTNKSVYCKDVGEVSSIFTQPSPLGEYKTETKLESFRKGK